jgi:Uma2 family endonuclease
MAVERRLMTVEEFWEDYAGKPYELNNGEIVPVTPTGFAHGATEQRAGSYIGDFVYKNRLGEVVTGETGFRLGSHTVRGADVAFISNEKLAQITQPEKYLPFAPDLVVEVVSPNDTADEISDKVELYLLAGTRLVWTFYPASRRVGVHYPDRTSKTLTADDMLDGEDMLPGFSVRVADLFPPEPPKKIEELPSE